MYKTIIITVIIVSIISSLWGYSRIPNRDKHRREFATLGIGLIIPLFTLIVPLIMPQEGTKIIFPELEKKIEENNKLKKTVEEKDKIILNTTKEKENLSDQVKNLNEKNFAELKSTNLVIDGLKKDTKGSVALVNNSTYINQDTVQKILDQQTLYDENDETIYIGTKDKKVTKDALEDDYTMLYNGEGYLSLGSMEDSSIKEPKVAGVEMTQGFILEGSRYNDVYGLFRLDGKYSSIEFDAGMMDNTDAYSIENGVIKLELDDEEKHKDKISTDISSKHYKFDVTDAKTLKIILSDSNTKFGFYNVIFNKV
ncbi:MULTISPECIES: hypothetical protein [Enterococcus]|uniref:hypothetical protein n=1 Tax=Enterococcus TaxID=1350 RepID=UPI000A5B6769|nr:MULTISPECIES: hypothetical protein [Enterococcus]MDT2751531.1 hypothetical protein [Enterococcus thailandicus]MDT2776361.1 hypothetical protein [Enterococcus thailandicus]MDT2794930.1 hypothetical protein [Enterococcus thailandicus]OTP22591.1 hypothetical protein A5800_000403 [Enterococcus sp. 5B7_DIV0075]